MNELKDPVDVIAGLCHDQPEGVLEKIAEVLGFGESQVADAIRAARNSAFEAAAQECDRGRHYAAAARIRRMKVDAPPSTPKQGEGE